MDSTEPGSTFKLQIFSLTGVPPERQKVLIKGGQLKDDQDMSLLSLKPGHSFMLLGTAEQGFKLPEKKPLFLEDMTTAEMAKSVSPSKSRGVWLTIAYSTPWNGEFGKYVLYECNVTSLEEYS